jgi:dolichol-phosphate mannosyltransferase
MFNTLSIVIPVYNEGENILATLTEIALRIRTPHTILIVYDFDEDNTLPAIQSHAAGQNIRLVKNRYGRGALNAIKTGFACATDEVVLVMMADLSDDLAKVDAMFARINEGYDIVCGCRYRRGGGQIGGPRLKKLLSRAAGLSLHYLAGIPTRDITNSFKMYRKSVLDEIPIESTGGFELGMELVVKAFRRGRKIADVPATWRDRSAGTSRFRLWRWLPHYLRWYGQALRARI